MTEPTRTPAGDGALEEHLRHLYGDRAAETRRRLEALIDRYRDLPPTHRTPPADRMSEADALLITYADQFRAEGEAPLTTLGRMLRGPLRDTVSGVHLLPFYPATSDDGFSVVDYLSVDGNFGSWSDVEALGETHRLMFDAVINHVSVSSPWFQAFLRDEAPYDAYFITADPGTDLSSVVRPRTSPLLTPFETPSGTKHVWTTFSADQVDLDYANPDVLVDIARVLLEYGRRGAEILRLDAVTYLWKEAGSASVHHANTHRVLKVLRAVVERASPAIVLLTETNVPHDENVSYFGNGRDEAQMVYNFALPPLVLHSFHTERAVDLAEWASGLSTPSDETTFFNFLASHDGIGVRPVERLLSPEARDRLVERTIAHGGRVSGKSNPDGSVSPYELNISYFDALSDPEADEPLQAQVDRFLTAHAIMLALAGVPGIYVHSLLGSRSAPEEVALSGRARSINRAKFEAAAVQREVADPASLRRRVLDRFRALLGVRTTREEFAPHALQEVLATPPEVFGLRRGGRVVCLHNVSGHPVTVGSPLVPDGAFDLIGARRVADAGGLVLPPWSFRWLEDRAR